MRETEWTTHTPASEMPPAPCCAEVALEILDSISDGLLAVDSEFRITYLNAEAEKQLGLSREKATGQLLWDVDPSAREEHAQSAYRRVAAEKNPAVFDTYDHAADRFRQVKAAPARSGGLTIQLSDITETKKTERALAETQRRWLRLVDSSIIGIATAGVDGIHYGNEEFLRLVGYTREDLAAGRADWAKATPPEYLHLDLQALEEIRERGECTPFEKEYQHPDGTRTAVLIGAAKLSEEPLEWVAYVVDVTCRKRAEEALRLSQERLRIAVESAELAAWEVDLASWRIEADTHSLRVFGLDAADTELSRWLDQVHPEDRQNVSKQFLEAINGGPEYQAEYRVLHSGEVRWVYARGRVLKDASGRAVRAVGIAQDITERKRVEEELLALSERMNEHLSNTPVAVIEFDSNFLITRWSGEAERMFGWTAGETIGKTFSDFRWVHDEDRSRVDHMCADLVAGRKTRVRAANRNYRKDGSVVYMEWYNSVRFDAQGGFSSLLSIGIDVSERKAAEDALESAARELKRSNDDLQQFAYAVSHDLQEPLRNISTYIQILQKDYLDKLADADAKELLSGITGGVTRMRHLIRDLLDYARLDQRSGNSQVPMDNILRFAVANLADAIRESGAQIIHDPLPDVKGDPIHLSQLLQNLIGNAIKYRRPDVAPRIHVSATRQGDDWIVAVSDNGIGIAPESYDRIFGVFKRLHGRDIPGSGIGLAICKKIIERQGGRIWVESRQGEGSTFYFTIAAADEARALSQSSALPAREA